MLFLGCDLFSIPRLKDVPANELVHLGKKEISYGQAVVV